MATHWRWEKDREGLVWLTFDKQGESANTFSKGALQELGSTLAEIAGQKPRGLIIRSAKDNFIAGADVEEFTRFKTPEEAMAFVKLGWDAFQKTNAGVYDGFVVKIAAASVGKITGGGSIAIAGDIGTSDM